MSSRRVIASAVAGSVASAPLIVAAVVQLTTAYSGPNGVEGPDEDGAIRMAGVGLMAMPLFIVIFALISHALGSLLVRVGATLGMFLIGAAAVALSIGVGFGYLLLRTGENWSSGLLIVGTVVGACLAVAVPAAAVWWYFGVRADAT